MRRLSRILALPRASIDKLKSGPLLPDVPVYHQTVRDAFQYNEFFKLAGFFNENWST